MFGAGHDVVAGANAAGHGVAGAKGAGGAADASGALHDGLQTMRDTSVATRPTLRRTASAPALFDTTRVPNAIPVTRAAAGSKVLDRTKVIVGAAFKFVTAPIRWASKAMQWVKEKYIAMQVARAKTLLFKHGPEHLVDETKAAEAIKAARTHPLRKGLNALGVDSRFANPDLQNHVALWNVEFKQTRLYAVIQWFKSGSWRKLFGGKLGLKKAGVADESTESVASDGKNAQLAQETADAEKNAKLAQETADADKMSTNAADETLNHGSHPTSIAPKSGKSLFQDARSGIRNFFRNKITLPIRRMAIRLFIRFFKPATQNKGDTKLLTAPEAETEASRAHGAASGESETTHLSPTRKASGGADELNEAHKHDLVGSSSSKDENSHLNQSPQEPHEQDTFHDTITNFPKDNPHPLPGQNPNSNPT
jgi:hypothetical protein